MTRLVCRYRSATRLKLRVEDAPTPPIETVSTTDRGCWAKLPCDLGAAARSKYDKKGEAGLAGLLVYLYTQSAKKYGAAMLEYSKVRHDLGWRGTLRSRMGVLIENGDIIVDDLGDGRFLMVVPRAVQDFCVAGTYGDELCDFCAIHPTATLCSEAVSGISPVDKTREEKTRGSIDRVVGLLLDAQRKSGADEEDREDATHVLEDAVVSGGLTLEKAEELVQARYALAYEDENERAYMTARGCWSEKCRKKLEGKISNAGQ